MNELQRTDGVFNRVLTQVLAAQCRQVQAVGGAMLQLVENKSPAVLAAFPPSASDDTSPKWIAPALDTCREVFSNGKAAIVAVSAQPGSDAPPGTTLFSSRLKKITISGRWLPSSSRKKTLKNLRRSPNSWKARPFCWTTANLN